MKQKMFVSKEELSELYLIDNKSSHVIGRQLGVNSKTVWYWLKKYGLSVRSRSESLLGERNYMYGTHHSEETKKKLSKKLSGRKVSIEVLQKLSENTKNQWKNPSTRKIILSSIQSKAYRTNMSKIVKERSKNKAWIQKLSNAQKRLWKNPEERAKRIKASRKAMNIKPNKPEQKILDIIRECNLPFKYVGDGSAIIAGVNPDFVNFDNNKIIEMFGRVFHDPGKSFRPFIPLHQQYQGRIDLFSKKGYDCLIIWDDELENQNEVKNKILRFNND